MTRAETNNSSNDPIFVVGTPRSGTTLMQKILNSHSDVWLSQETHYFQDLRRKMGGREQGPLSPEEVELAEDYFLSLTHRLYGINKGNPERGWMNRMELRTLAQRLGSGTNSYFEAFCQLSALRQNKTRWGEKTPRHVFELPTIFTLYPNAQVVCMVRHPGGVMASYRDWKKVTKNASVKRRLISSYSPTLCSLNWKAALKAAFQARNQFGNNRVYIQRFEDLLRKPEFTLKALTAWLSLDFQPSMLEISSANSSYIDLKGKTKVGLSQAPAERWREKLSSTEIGILQHFCGTLLSEAGYDHEPARVPLALIIWLWITLPFAVQRSLLANRSLIGNIPEYIWHRFRLAIHQ